MPKPKKPRAIALLLLGRARKLISDPRKLLRGHAMKTATGGYFTFSGLHDSQTRRHLSCACADGALIAAAYGCGAVGEDNDNRIEEFFHDPESGYGVAVQALARAMIGKIRRKSGLNPEVLRSVRQIVWDINDGYLLAPGWKRPISHRDIIACFFEAEAFCGGPRPPRERRA